MWRGPQIPAIECHGLTGMLQMNPPFMSKTSALHEHHACLYFVSSLTARLRRKTSVCDVLCRVPNPPQCVCCVFTLYRIVFWRTRESYRMEFRFTHKNGDFGAISVKRREAVPRRSLKWRVTSDRCSYYTGWLFVSSSKLIWYSMIIVLLFWFRFTDSWRAKEIKMSSTLIYLTLKKTFTWLVLYY